jgi:hypothetical protein
LGSAGGFAAGISRAVEDGFDFIWLLDDDNVAEPGALKELMTVAQRGGTVRPSAFLAFRPQRPYQRRLVEGCSSRRVFPSRSSFLYFHLGNRVRNAILRKPRRETGATDGLPIPYGAYSGALIPRDTVTLIGLPDVRLRLYEDDTEYLYRITRAGGRVLLVARAKLHDVEGNWLAASDGRTGPSRLLLADSAARVYFGVRNRVYFEKWIYSSNPLMYAVNRRVYLATLWILSRRANQRDRLELILRAIRDGESASFDDPPEAATL